MLHVGKILEKVEVIGLHVQNDRHGGEKTQKRVAVFAALGDDRVALADAIARVQQLQGAADHHGRVLLRGHEDVRGHAGGGRFAVCAGDAEGVLIALHDRAPGLRALENGDAARHRAGDLGVIVVNGGGADDKVALAEVICRVADGNGNAKRAQMLDGGASVHVAALNLKPHAVQHFCKRAHRNAADACKMRALSGDEIGENILLVGHGIKSFPCAMHRRFTFYGLSIII